jgi:hypothetical protein
MMRALLNAALVGLLVLVGTGCARVDQFNNVDPGTTLVQGAWTVVIKNNWIRHADINNMARPALTRYIKAEAPSVSFDMDQVRRQAAELDMGRMGQHMQPMEYADHAVYFYTTILGWSNITVTDSASEPFVFGGLPGFKTVLNITTYNGLEKRMVIIGAEHDGFQRRLIYEADVVNNFDKYLPEFMAVVASVKFRHASCVLAIYCLD